MYQIRLKKRDHSIVVRRVQRTIKLKHSGLRGPQGVQGIQGETGAGVPAGGLENQVLQKASNDDYDYQWMVPVFGDLTYTQDFTVTSTVTVNHNLNKYPSVTVLDSTGGEVEGDVNYVSLTQLLIQFAAPFSGKVICN